MNAPASLPVEPLTEPQADTAIEVDVAIVGAGPVGVTIANLLGHYGVRAVVIDRSPDILPYPRAVGMDDEALRVFQTVGLAEPLLEEMIQNVPLRMFDRHGRVFADIRPGSREFGWCRRNIFMQQLAERTLRDGLARYPHVRTLLGHEVVTHAQDEAGVTLTLQHADGGSTRVRAAWCVAADGGRSTLRTLLDVALGGTTHPMKWLVVDVRNAGVDAPYTALHCDPARPHVCIYLPFNFRRWEFMVFAHENEDEMAGDAAVRRLLAPHVRDAAALEIVRARIYTHHSRVAERFVVGRTVFAGDAAHLSPPWIGQGLNIGLRDAGNLGWKLAALVRGQMDAAPVLASYEAERRGHARAMIDLADTFGRVLMPTSRALAVLRDLFFRSVGRLPGVRRWVLEMRFKPMPRYGRGGLVVPRPGAPAHDAVGRMFIQPDVETAVGRREKLDEVLGSGFALVGWQCDPQALLEPAALRLWQSLGARFVRVERSRSGASREARLSSVGGTACVEDVDNLLADWFERQRADVAVLRPDRYVAALADSRDTLDAASEAFRQLVRPTAKHAPHAAGASIPSPALSHASPP